MKKMSWYFGVLLIPIMLFGCQQQRAKESNPDVLTPEKIAVINDEILEVTTNWSNACVAMNVNEIVNLWHNSQDLRVAENGLFFNSYDDIKEFINYAFGKCEEMNHEWLNREIQILTPEIALFNGRFDFHLHFKEEPDWQGISAMTATFIKRDGQWKIINSHESTEPAE